MVAIIIIAIVVLVALYVISANNRMVRLRNQGEESFAQIDAHLKQRYDLVPNLVETVKGYTKHENETLTAVIAARNQGLSAGSVEEKDQADVSFRGALKSLFALSESYPELKANEQFLDLQRQLASIEKDLLSARKYYNAVIKEYNTMTEVFPSSVVAGMFGHKKQPYLQVEEEARQRVDVKF